MDSMRYEYYVHYKGIDRRNDRWVTEHFIKVDKDAIIDQSKNFSKEEEEKKTQESFDREKRFFNDENHGMNER
jgi:hypothetical protein